MNKKLIMFITAVVFTLFIPLCVSARPEIRVHVNGVLIELDQPPVIIEGRTLVPTRGVFEAMGFNVEWDYRTQTVYLFHSNGSEVTITIGRYHLVMNDVATSMEVPAQIINGRTMIPLRTLAKRFDAIVEWDEEQGIVNIHDYRVLPPIASDFVSFSFSHEAFTFFVVSETGEIEQTEFEVLFFLDFILGTWFTLNGFIEDRPIRLRIPFSANVGTIGRKQLPYPTPEDNDFEIYFSRSHPSSAAFEAFINGENALLLHESLERTLRGLYYFGELKLIFVDEEDIYALREYHGMLNIGE